MNNLTQPGFKLLHYKNYRNLRAKNAGLQGKQSRPSVPFTHILLILLCAIAVFISTGAFSQSIINHNVASAGSHSRSITTTGMNTETWTGDVDDDWGNGSNWLSGLVPSASDDVVIPEGLSIYPSITATKTLHDLNIESGASLTVSHGTLRISGSINNAGILDVSGGTIEMNGTTPQVIPANAFANNKILNLIISNNVTLEGIDTLTGTLSFGSRNKNFETGDFLILKSTALRTARINDITNAGDDVGNTITGKISIEHYIPLRKAWRLLSIPLATSNAPTINDAWQEGVTTASGEPNPNPGYGVHITGGSSVYGFDQSSTNNASVKFYNTTTNTFNVLPPMPGTDRPITDYPGYFVYIRGDRSINLMQGTSAAITATTLRMKGEVKINTQSQNVSAAGFTILGNPFASSIDFETLTRNNVANMFYTWDPELSGAYGLGAYVVFIWNEETETYDQTASVSPLSKYIPGGEAIIIQSDDRINPATIDIKETDKVSELGPSFSRTNGVHPQLRINLLGIDSTVLLLDGILTTYSDQNNNAVDKHDAKKMFGSSESINIKRGSDFLAIERRSTITTTDTTFLNIYQMKPKSYRLEISATGINTEGLIAFIHDSYSNTINNTVLDMNGNTLIDFTVNSDPESYSVTRFSIVFKVMSVVPVTFKTVKAYQHDKDIAVEWTTENEINVSRYEIERSVDENKFTKINSTAAIANGGKAFYQVLDTDPAKGNNFYRIHSISNNGSAAYSNIVKVNRKEENNKPTFEVYPNPVATNNIFLELSNLSGGIYNLRLFNKLGQLVATKKIDHTAGNSSITFEVANAFPAGRYELRLTGGNTRIVTALIKR